LETHTNMGDDGYIGVAKDFDERMQRHYAITSRMDTHFARAIRLYGWKNLIKQVVFEGTEKDCYAFEESLRSKFQIGWNEAIGGHGGDRSQCINYDARAKPIGNRRPKHGVKNPFFGKKHSDEARAINSKRHAKVVITTPDGLFYGFSALARHLDVHKKTAKSMAYKRGWKIESKPEVY